MAESFILPGLALFCVLSGLRARIDVYAAFVSGAREGLKILADMAPYLCVILMATGLLRESGILLALEKWLEPILGIVGLPQETAWVLLLRPFSGSASLAAVNDVMLAAGADSRAARICCVVSAASETVFFTGSMYMGAAGMRRSRYAFPAAMAAYLVGILAAGVLIR